MLLPCSLQIFFVLSDVPDDDSRKKGRVNFYEMERLGH